MKTGRLIANLGIVLILLGLGASIAWRQSRSGQSVQPQGSVVYMNKSELDENFGSAPADRSAIISAAELKPLVDGKDPHVVVLDIRDRDQFEQEHIPSSKNIPADEIEVRADEELDKSNLIVIAYSSCSGVNQTSLKISLLNRSLMTSQAFLNVKVLADGVDGWRAAGFKTEDTLKRKSE